MPGTYETYELGNEPSLDSNQTLALLDVIQQLADGIQQLSNTPRESDTTTTGLVDPMHDSLSKSAEVWEDAVELSDHEGNGPRDRFYKFMQLPLELRDLVYTFAMNDLPTRFVMHSHAKLSPLVLCPKTLPNICFTSKQVRLEAILAYIRRTRFILQLFSPEYHCQRSLIDFLSQFPDEQGFQAIRMLSYIGASHLYSSPYGLNYPGALVSRCTGLRSLTLYIEAYTVIKSEMLKADPRCSLRNPQEVEEELRLSGLFKVEKLKNLKIVCTNGSLYVGDIAGAKNPADIFQNLGILLHERFKMRASSVQIEMIYADRSSVAF